MSAKKTPHQTAIRTEKSVIGDSNAAPLGFAVSQHAAANEISAVITAPPDLRAMNRHSAAVSRRSLVMFYVGWSVMVGGFYLRWPWAVPLCTLAGAALILVSAHYARAADRIAAALHQQLMARAHD